MEAYTAVYDDELRDELDYENELMENDLAFLDDLSDNELVQVMEEIFAEGEYTLDECLNIFDGVLIQEEAILDEARLTPRQQQERQKFKSQQKSQMAASEKAAEKGRKQYASAERRTQRIERLKSAASRAKTLAGGAVSAVAGGARDVSQAAQKRLSQAKAGVQKFLRRAGKQATAGAERVSRTLQGRDIGKERGQRRAVGKMRSVARAGIGKAITGLSAGERSARANTAAMANLRKGQSVGSRAPISQPQASPYGTESSGQGTLFSQTPKGKLSRPLSKVTAPRRDVGRPERKGPATRQTSLLGKMRTKVSENFDFILQTILEDLIQEGYAYDVSEALEILEDLTETEFDTLVESYLEDEVETLDFYDDVMNYLVSEGFAETEEDATAIMANMSEEWRDEILDEILSEDIRAEFKAMSPERRQEWSRNIRTGADELQKVTDGMLKKGGKGSYLGQKPKPQTTGRFKHNVEFK